MKVFRRVVLAVILCGVATYNPTASTCMAQTEPVGRCEEIRIAIADYTVRIAAQKRVADAAWRVYEAAVVHTNSLTIVTPIDWYAMRVALEAERVACEKWKQEQWFLEYLQRLLSLYLAARIEAGCG